MTNEIIIVSFRSFNFKEKHNEKEEGWSIVMCKRSRSKLSKKPLQSNHTLEALKERGVELAKFYIGKDK